MNRLEALEYYTNQFLSMDMEQEEAEAEAKLALATVLGSDIHEIYLHGQQKVTDSQEYRMETIISRRETGEPLAYILKEKWFMGMPFFVNQDVLIPRRETEILVETAAQTIRMEALSSVHDLCTGSGCVAVSLARYTRAKVSASDISKEALTVAAKNAKDNLANVSFCQSDLFENIHEKYDVITANPPYIAPDEFPTLPKDVREFEPSLALEAGDNGLEFYLRIIAEAPEHLNQGGALVMEIGATQAKQVTFMLKEAGFHSIIVHKDYCGLDRVVIARI